MSKNQLTGGDKRLFRVLIPNRGSCVSFADDFIVLLCISFFCRVSQLNTVGFSFVFFEPAVLYFTDSEVRQWQAIDTSLGATPKPPRKEAKAI